MFTITHLATVTTDSTLRRRAAGIREGPNGGGVKPWPLVLLQGHLTDEIPLSVLTRYPQMNPDIMLPQDLWQEEDVWQGGRAWSWEESKAKTRCDSTRLARALWEKLDGMWLPETLLGRLYGTCLRWKSPSERERRAVYLLDPSSSGLSLVTTCSTGY